MHTDGKNKIEFRSRFEENAGTEVTVGLKHAPLTERIIGVFYDVYNELGHGFLESVYQEAMAIGLREAGLSVDREVVVAVRFRGRNIGEFRADLLVERTVVLELKTARALDSVHEAQLLHYLKATEFEIGLLLNFGARPQFRRLILDNDQKRIRLAPKEVSV